MASEVSDAPDDITVPAPRRRARVVLFASGTMALLVGGIWLLRAPIADNIVANQLQERGVKAEYRVISIGPRTQVLADVVVGDPQRPDLIVRRVEVDVGWTWTGPAIIGVRAEGARLFGRWQDGRMSLGEVDKLLPAQGDEAFTLPELYVALSDARARIDTPWGVIGARIDGAGPLRQNFRGRVALVTDRLAVGGCQTGRVSLFGTMRTDFGRPSFVGPVRGVNLDCPASGARMARFDAQIETSLAAGLKSWTGQFDAMARGGTAAGAVLAEATASGAFRGNSAATKIDFSATGRNGRYGELRIGGVTLAGSANAGAELGGEAKLTFTRAQLPPLWQAQVARSAATLKNSPIGPIADQLARAAARALSSLSGEAELQLVGNARTRRIEIIAPQLSSISGARLLGDATSRLSILLGGVQPLFLVDGRWRIGGGGLPEARVQMRRSADGRLVGLASLPPLVAGNARLSLTPVRVDGDRVGRLRLVTTASLSGPVGGGRVDGLTMRLDGLVQPGGDFALAGGCQRVTLAGGSFAGVVLGKNAVQLCGAQGQPLFTYRGGRLSGEIALIAPELRGKTGDSALWAQAERLQYGLASGDLALDALAVMVGEGASATNFSAANINGQVTGSGLSGQFAGAAGEIGEIPLDMTEIAGGWAWQAGALTLNGGLVVNDQLTLPRFAPLISRDARLTFADGRIDASANFAEVTTNTAVGRADIAHRFENGTGSADLVIMSMRFNEAFQPDQLTPLALGVIANASGTLAGRGRIDWNGDGVTSSGTFTTAGSDFAAAFGSVNGASTTIVFDDLLAVHTPPGQRISLDEVNPGIPVVGGLIDYQLLDAQKIRIEGGRWPFAGGELTLKPTVIDFDVDAVRRFEFELHGVDAGVFLTEFGFDNLSAKGVFDGVLPVEFSGLGARVVDGRLVARSGGGEVAYVGELSNYNLGLFPNYAFNMLKSLSYKEMTITLNGDLDGEMLTDVKIVGLGQGEGATRNIITRQIAKLPIIFNVKINAPFRQLIGSARSLYDPSVLIDQNRDALIEAQRAAEGPSVQPPESEPVP